MTTAPRPLPQPSPRAWGEGDDLLPLPLERERAGVRVSCIDSARLFGGTTEIHIDHHGVIYRLKQTSSGKLILTK